MGLTHKSRVLRGKVMFSRIYELYKRLMKYDIKAFDEIETLEEAKEIIKMMVSSQYLHNQAYQMIKGNIKEDF